MKYSLEGLNRFHGANLTLSSDDKQGLFRKFERHCCQAHRGLPVGYLLLRYSVLFTVESLSLLYLLLYLDLYVLGDDAFIS